MQDARGTRCCFAGPAPAEGRDGAAFSLIEILVVAALMSVIVLGLMAMFTQTQRAFRLGMSQTDILESGRIASEVMCREFEEMTPCGVNRTNSVRFGAPVFYNFFNNEHHGAPNFYSRLVWFSTQVLPGGNPTLTRTNVMDDVFFLRRENQTWTGVGYFVRTNLAFGPNAGPVGTLYRFESSCTVAQFKANPGDLFAAFNSARSTANLRASRIVDGIVHFRVRPFDMNGWVLTNNPAYYYVNSPGYWTNLPAAMVSSNLFVSTGGFVAGETPWYIFYSNAVPASIEVELGILEQQTYERYRSIPVPAVQNNFLSEQGAAHVHLFRRTVPIRNVDPAAYEPLAYR